MINAPDHRLELLAPAFRGQVESLLALMADAGRPGRVFEAFRSDARQRDLYAQGRTKPGRVVTKAKSGVTTVHRYGLAVDVIHPTRLWSAPQPWWEAWWRDAATLGFTVGGRWTSFPDPPHIQWGGWKGSPPGWARTWITEEPSNLQRIWERLGVA